MADEFCSGILEVGVAAIAETFCSGLMNVYTSTEERASGVMQINTGVNP